MAARFVVRIRRRVRATRRSVARGRRTRARPRRPAPSVTASTSASISSSVRYGSPYSSTAAQRYIRDVTLSSESVICPLSWLLPIASSSSGSPRSATSASSVSDRVERVARGFGPGADVHAVHADVGVERLERVDGIRQPELLAHALEQARAHAAAEQRC